jgi:four helix bundle protein
MSRRKFPFESLEVWQAARKLVCDVHGVAGRFPKEEIYGLTSQLKRAALSVANNLAEGSGRSSYRDQAHFSSQAHASLMETACDLIIAEDLGFLNLSDSESILSESYDLGVRIHNLRESQLRRAVSN